MEGFNAVGVLFEEKGPKPVGVERGIIDDISTIAACLRGIPERIVGVIDMNRIAFLKRPKRFDIASPDNQRVRQWAMQTQTPRQVGHPVHRSDPLKLSTKTYNNPVEPVSVDGLTVQRSYPESSVGVVDLLGWRPYAALGPLRVLASCIAAPIAFNN